MTLSLNMHVVIVHYMCLCTLVLSISGVHGARRHYATDSCGLVHGPDHLTVIEFDRDVNYVKSKPADQQNLIPPEDLRNTLWECVIVVRGIPSPKTRTHLGIEWRSFHIRDRDINTVEQSVDKCGKAYVTMYHGAAVKSSVQSVTMCGKDTRKTFYEWEGSYVTFKFHIDFRRNESYMNCVDPATVEDGAVTSKPLCSTTPASSGGKEPEDTYPYPEVYFRVDITSFDYDCATSNDQLLKCNDSQRCIARELMCDFFFSHNCKSPSYPVDVSDQTRDAPAYCFRKPPTTPVPTTTTEAPTPPFPWVPVMAPLCGILSVLLLCWCCVRPGYLPWRLSRMRNMPCCNTRHCVLCRGRTRCCPCVECATEAGIDPYDGQTGYKRVGYMYGRGQGPKPIATGGPFNVLPHFDKKLNGRVCTPPCSGVGPYRPPDYVCTYGKDPTNFATEWLKLASSDGAHLREQR